jgi:Zn finger protein HypA/HybF involved in hydrogenase expression
MRKGYSRGSALVSGETVTPGTFICRNCNHRYEVSSGVVNLPVCPRCQNETWRLK